MDKSKEQEYLNQVEENKNKFLKDNNLKTKMLLTQATNVVLTGRLLTKAYRVRSLSSHLRPGPRPDGPECLSSSRFRHRA